MLIRPRPGDACTAFRAAIPALSAPPCSYASRSGAARNPRGAHYGKASDRDNPKYTPAAINISAPTQTKKVRTILRRDVRVVHEGFR